MTHKLYLSPFVQVGANVILMMCFGLIYSCSQPEETYLPESRVDIARAHAFVGDQTCQSCHGQVWEQWKGSHHDYAIAEAHTTWSVLNVSCEACHGPGQDHVEFMNSPESEEASRDRIRQDVALGQFTSQIDEFNTCAPCRSCARN